ncbi:MAG TPA: type II secretion system protein GspH [Pseudomonas sp.]|nr:type II secretion system protein GspH [Pseudomonadales bacterium]MAQ52302.1 type II secretion system protein GspH [Pseudomonas sp.]MEB3736435.1 type II secretion system minor pseudopilin GspH [Halopseudomonas pachastrellae]MED5491171.1 type II secretion system minor pseudopilin GspH [Pseudomonadota bacterium]MBF76973.1 type II secretion system protein GspH [Pseudomonadales bacterium]|tara:strand:+ start:21463 stop:22005 length:543 start_codon:yes stop_codon:yes gene_type:complete
MSASPARRSAPAASAGFTLIEVLVVLVLIGVIAGLATLSLGNGAERELRKESDRLAAVLRLARDELLISGGNERALGLRRDSYSVLDLVLLDDASREWRPVQDPQLGPHWLPEGLIELDFEADEQAGRLSGSTTWTPQIRLGNTGEMTPGLIVLTETKGDLKRYIRTDLNGQIEVFSERP